MDDNPDLKSAPDPKSARSADARLLDLSWPQVVGGALAAMTAAVLGSRLGVAGTVLGAALASVCAAVFGSVYTTSIRRTQKMARTALTIAQNQRGRSRQVPQATTLVESDQLTTAPAAGSPAATDDRPPATSRPKPMVPHRFRRVLITSIVGAASVFVVAIGAIASVEVASGRTLDGSKGTTTVGEVLRGSGGHSPHGQHSEKHGPGNEPSNDTSSPPSTDPSSGPQPSTPPGDQASGEATPPAPQASGSAAPGSDPSADQNSGGQDSGTSGDTSGSSGSASSGSGSSGSDGSGQSGTDGSGSSGSGPDGSGVSGS